MRSGETAGPALAQPGLYSGLPGPHRTTLPRLLRLQGRVSRKIQLMGQPIQAHTIDICHRGERSTRSHFTP